MGDRQSQSLVARPVIDPRIFRPTLARLLQLALAAPQLPGRPDSQSRRRAALGQVMREKLCVRCASYLQRTKKQTVRAIGLALSPPPSQAADNSPAAPHPSASTPAGSP